MDEGEIIDDEIWGEEHCMTEGPIEYRGIRTHFWIERSYYDNEGVEHWQNEQEIKRKLWQITKFVNLKKVKEQFPGAPWEEILLRLWNPFSLHTLLQYLCENYKGAPVASLPLQQIRIQSRTGEIYHPRLQITVVPRKVEWETGKFGCLVQVPQEDGSHKLEYNPIGGTRYKTAITVGKIVVLIRTTATDRQPEISRNSEAKQGFMGARQDKMEKGVLTPIEVVIGQHPTRAKRIRRCVTKWHKRTSGRHRWPMTGTFNLACCDEVESELRHIEARDTKASYALKNKRAKEREEPPCPQEPTQPIMGQYPLLETTELGGQMEGTFTVTLTKNTKKEQLKRRKPLTPRKRLPMEETLVSDTEDTDGSIADEEDEEAGVPETELLRHEPQNRRVSGGAWTTDMELTGLVGQEEAPSCETQAPPEKRHKDQKRRQLKEKDTRLHHSSCHDLRRREFEFRYPQKEKQERLLKYQSTPDMEGLLDREMERLREEWWRQRATVDPPPGPSSATSPGQVEGCHQSPYVENDCGDVVQKMQELIERTNEKLDHMAKEIEALEEETKQPQGPKQGPKDPNLTSTKKHVTLRLQGTMETDKGRTEGIQDTDSELAPYDSAAPSRSLSPEGMKLRNGRVIRVLKTAEEEDEDSEGSPMCPLVTKTNGRQQYEPWPFMDMIGLAERLPVLTDGADKWILALEETTAGIRLALGDIKAILMYVAGKQTTQEILTDAGLTAAFGTNINDGVEFGRYRSRVWAQLRKHYPAKRDPSKLEGETMGEDECPSKFLHNFQKRWKEETGEAWNANKTTQSLFKMMVRKAMPEEVQRRLEGVVGLMKMEWPLFTEHIVHHVELYKKDKKKKEEDDKQLANKLTQLQLGELSKQRAMTLLLMPHITITTTSHKCQEEVAASDPPEGGAEEETVDGEGAETTHPITSRVIRSNPVSNREPIRVHQITSVGGVDSQATYELSALATHGTARHKIVHGKAQHKIGPIHNSHTLGKVICAPLLYSAYTPVNLLGRDILCPLKAKIMCTQDGLYLDFPDDSPHSMMSQLPQTSPEKRQALAYWLQLTPEDSHLKQKWVEWEKWICMHYDTAHTPTLPLHCTLMYDKDQTHVDYQECWDAVINKKPCLITSEDLFLGPEGVAAAVRLPDELSGWFQVSNSTPHVTLLVAANYESHHLGPMVRRALQVQEWTPTQNKYIHISEDKQFIRISLKVELTPQRHPYPGLEPGREQFPQIRKGTARPPRGQKETKQKGMATPPHWNRGQEGQHVLHRDAGQRQPRAMAAVQPRVRAAGRYQRGYQQWPRAHQRGAPQPPGLAANLNLMSHHLLEIGKIMRGQVQRERWLQRQKDRREKEQRQREKKEKKALAQNQAGVGQQGGQTQAQAQVQTQTQTQTQNQETQTPDNQTQKRGQPPGKREGLKSRGGAKVGVIGVVLLTLLLILKVRQSAGAELGNPHQKQMSECLAALGTMAAKQGQIPHREMMQLTYYKSHAYDDILVEGPGNIRLHGQAISSHCAAEGMMTARVLCNMRGCTDIKTGFTLSVKVARQWLKLNPKSPRKPRDVVMQRVEIIRTTTWTSNMFYQWLEYSAKQVVNGGNDSMVMGRNYNDTTWIVTLDLTNGTVPLADIFWMCENDLQVKTVLPENWTGICAPVMLTGQITIMSFNNSQNNTTHSRRRRSADTQTISWEEDASVYITWDQVPQGVPRDHQAVSDEWIETVQLLIRRTMASVAGQFVIIDQSSPPKTITEIYENMGGHEGKELKDFNQSTGLNEGNQYEIMAPGKILSQDDQTWGSGEEEYEEIV
ncbi:hypothetical protein ABVT39_007504 [Epinephelus coioides]